MPELPAELWARIFDLAADDDAIFQYGLPTSFSQSKWFQDTFGDWALRSPRDVLDCIQGDSYGTKKAIVRTCKQWNSIGHESLFRFLFFNDPARLLAVCDVLDSSSAAATTATASLGWWTRRIHLNRFYAHTTREVAPEKLQNALIRIIGHCPNLEICSVDWPMDSSTFAGIAAALEKFNSLSLRALHLNVPSHSLPTIVQTLNALPYICAAHIDVAPGGRPHDLDVHLRLPYLQQLSLSGHPHALVQKATRWHLPVLHHFSLHCETLNAGLPDTPAFLAAHGAGLVSLDLSSAIAMPLSRIIAACPALVSLAFNGDWLVVIPGDPNAPVDTPPLAHATLASVGLHGIENAFGDAAGAPERELETSMNDRNLALLCERARFPALKHIRVLSRGLLGDLDRAGGPAAGAGMQRWERWWKARLSTGIELEDCTGGILGEMP